MKIAFVFPGQGSAEVGMGAEMAQAFPLVREYFDITSDLLGYDLFEITQNGPMEKLVATQNAQPAIFALSAACLDIFRKESGIDVPDWTAGHSLGEYNALYAAGSLTLRDAAELVCLRGRYVAEACDENPGTMAAIMKLSEEDVEKLIAEASKQGVVVAANFNTPGQVVVSGDEAGVAAAVAGAKEMGGRGIPLKVSGAFHSPLIAEAGERLKADLERFNVEPPACRFIPNASGKVASQPHVIRDLLYKQIARPVRWMETMSRMAEDGVGTYVEFGHGKVIAGMLKKAAPDARIFNVSSPENLEMTIKELEG
jgi:[acyl-carrier-protein] S-malonyltransferase